jgi:hypothetical protein
MGFVNFKAFLLRYPDSLLEFVHIMKTTFQLFALAVLSLALSSCCGLLPCGGSLTAEKEVTTYQEVQRTVYSGKTSHVVTDRVPVTTTQTVKHRCNKCGSSYCPKPQCCGIVSDQVLARATAQGGTGEPQIGLIPTMKVLAD